MKKHLLFISALLLIIGGFASVYKPLAAKATLYSCFQDLGMEWTNVDSRAEVAAEYAVWGYEGTAAQNTLLESRMCRYSEQPLGEEELGFSVVSRYKTTLGSSMTSNQTTIPVSSITTFDNTTLTMALLGSKVFLTLEPGSVREEIVVCTAITSSQFSGCTRGLAFSGTSEAAVSANQKAHNAGSVVVMSNVQYVFEQLVDKDSNEAIEGTKTASSTEFIFGTGVSTTLKLYFQNTSATSTSSFIQFNGGQLGWSDDGTNTFTFAEGSSGLSASTTKGIFITDSLIGINASSTIGMTFDGAGNIYQKTSSTAGILTDSNGIYLDSNYAVLDTDTTSTPTASKIPIADASGKIANGWLSYSNLSTEFSAGETIDGSSTPVPVYLGIGDGELYKGDASFGDERSGIEGFIVDSTSDGNSADLVFGGILTIPSETITSTISSVIDQNSDDTTNENLFAIDSSNDRFSQAFMVGDQVGDISTVKVKGSHTGAARSFVMDIYAIDSDGEITGSSLGTSDVVNTAGGGDAYRTWTFAPPVEVQPGDRRAWVLRSSGTDPDGSNYFALRRPTGQDEGYNMIKEGATSGYTNTGYNSTNGGSSWNSDSTAIFQTYTTQREIVYGDPVFLSETSGEYTTVRPTGTGATTKKIGTLMSETKMKVDFNEDYKFLGSTVVGGDYDNGKFYAAAPPRAEEVLIKAKTSDSGGTIYGEGDLILRRGSKTSGTLNGRDGSNHTVDAVWSGNTIIFTFSADTDAHSVFFYGY